MHQSIVQYALTLPSGVLTPGCVPREAPRRLQQGLVDAGTWGDAQKLAQVEDGG